MIANSTFCLAGRFFGKVAAAFSFVVALGLGQSGHAVAQNMNASSVMTACGTPDEAWVNFCNGYVQAIYDAAIAVGVDICIPVNTTRAEIADAVFRGLLGANENSGQQAMEKQSGATAVISIMQLNYPCS